MSSVSVITLSSSDDETPVTTPSRTSNFSKKPGPKSKTMVNRTPKASNGASVNGSNVNIVLPRDSGLLRSLITSDGNSASPPVKDDASSVLNGISSSISIHRKDDVSGKKPAGKRAVLERVNQVDSKYNAVTSSKKVTLNHVTIHKVKLEEKSGQIRVRNDASSSSSNKGCVLSPVTVEVKKDLRHKLAKKTTTIHLNKPAPTNHLASEQAKKEDSKENDCQVKEDVVKKVKVEVSECVDGNSAHNSDTSRAKEVVKRATARKRTSQVSSLTPSKKPRLHENRPPLCGRKLFNKFLNFISPRLDVTAEEETQILNRLERNFNEVDKQFIESKDFYHLICGTVKKIKANEKLIYMYIEDVRQELRYREAKTEKTVVPSESTTEDSTPSTSGAGSVNNEDQSEADARRSRVLTHLKDLLRDIDRRIQKLQNRELDLDDLDKEDSAYIREDLLKKKFMKVWNLICRAEQCQTNAGREVHKRYHYSGTIYQEINREVEKLVNKQKLFPNFCDIHDIIDSYCKRTRLTMGPAQMHKLAEEVFVNVGNDLKNRRIRDDQDTLGSYLLCGPATFDPADADETLKSKLEESAAEGEKKIQSVIDHYAEKQIELKLEPVEVKDDHSSKDSDEEEEEDDEEDNEESFALNTNSDDSSSESNDEFCDPPSTSPKEEENVKLSPSPQSTTECIILSD